MQLTGASRSTSPSPVDLIPDEQKDRANRRHRKSIPVARKRGVERQQPRLDRYIGKTTLFHCFM